MNSNYILKLSTHGCLEYFSGTQHHYYTRVCNDIESRIQHCSNLQRQSHQIPGHDDYPNPCSINSCWFNLTDFTTYWVTGKRQEYIRKAVLLREVSISEKVTNISGQVIYWIWNTFVHVSALNNFHNRTIEPVMKRFTHLLKYGEKYTIAYMLCANG